MKQCLAILLGLLLVASVGFAQTETLRADSAAPPKPAVQPPAPVTDLQAKDSPDDHGHSITLTWKLSADDGQGTKSVFVYEVFRWVPFYLDSMYALQLEIDSLTGLRDSYRHLIPRAKDMVSQFNAAGATDSAAKYTASLAEMQPRFKTLPEDIKKLQIRIDADWDRAPAAHEQYPNNGHWEKVGEAFAGIATFTNSSQKEIESDRYMPDFCNYYYRVDAACADRSIRTSSEIIGPIQSSGQWFNVGRTPSLFATSIFSLLVLIFVYLARKGKDLYVRPLSGIEAVDEAIGRATEMGKPILYVLGLGTAADIATIASFTVLGRVAKRVAEYQTELIVPTYDPIVMSVAQETVKSAYYDAGRPDHYKEDSVFFVTQNQFAYVGAVNGIMLRQLPATNIYMGKFFAESLILAETGALAGSIQIAGTDEIAQIPFFVVACDYTLIGEELYAASAYLGREPILLGSLKAQDYAKAAIIILAIIGLIAVNIGANGGGDSWLQFRELFRVVR
ncbi:MAG: DUF6754 domain-containing protein [Candidatus Zixiibacteriota bacterium]